MRSEIGSWYRPDFMHLGHQTTVVKVALHCAQASFPLFAKHPVLDLAVLVEKLHHPHFVVGNTL